MTETVRQFIEREQLLNHDKLYLVALSGGADSVCLLLLLQELDYNVEAVHCNFNLRGEESLRDEEFVKSLCRKYNIKLHLTHFDTRTYAELHKVSIEMAARHLRYHYFEQLRHDIGAEDICVAHHQDDSVETILMNLLRGTGIHGLQGIQPRRDHIVRPLLCVCRSDVEQWLSERGQDYVTDSTNLVADIVRNKLRLNVIPLLADCSPQAKTTIMATARRLAEAAKVYDHAICQSLGRLAKDDQADISALLAEPSPESLLYEWLSPKGFSPATIESIYQTVSRATEAAEPTSGQEWHSASHWLVVHRGKLILAKQEADRPTLRLPEAGTYVYDDDTKLRITTTEGPHIVKDANVCCLDAGKTRFPLTLRPTRPGDRFHPLGMKGSKLVSDYMTDRHASLIEKRRQLVLSNAEGEIVWLAGQRPDNRFRVTDETQETIIVVIF